MKKIRKNIFLVTFTSLLVIYSVFVSIAPLVKDQLNSPCGKRGYNNWSRVIYRNGEASKLECYNRKWEKVEITLSRPATTKN